MRIFAAGLATETNTFCPIPTGLSDFMVQRGRDSLAGRVCFPSLDLSKTWGQQAQIRGDEFIFCLNAWAQPSGITVRCAYESLRDEILCDLKAAMPVDGVLLSLHGAMVAEGYDDCEEDIVRRVRNIVGPSVVIGVEFDLHCNLSRSKIEAADIVLTYQEYPHTDINDRALQLFDLVIGTRLGKFHPVKALFDCRMVGMYPTSRQPLRAFVDEMKEMEASCKDVLCISLAHGFQFVDLPHVGAKMLVVADNDRELAEHVANDFGMRAYALRQRIGFDSLSLPMEEALTKALDSKNTPVVVADQSDNTGGGAPGDATFVLRWLLDHRAEGVCIAILYDPEVVRIAKRAGVGAKLSVRVGGKLEVSSGNPVDLDVTVLSVLENYMHGLPQQSGDPWQFPLGDVAALRCGGIDIVVGSERCQCFNPQIFNDLGIEPRSKRVLIVKSYQHFYAAFSSIARAVIYMAAPGAVPPDPRQLRYRHLDTRCLYPWIENPLGESR